MTHSKTDPDISVVMPVFNAETTLNASIQSVLAQSHANFELIIIDDGSTDGSLLSLLDWVGRDRRIRLMSRSNAGVSATRNFGVEMARAPLIAFLDADDLWHPDKLALHLAKHQQQPELAASYARIAFIAESALGLENYRTLSSVQPAALQLLDVLGENPVCSASNFVVQKQWLAKCHGFDTQLSHAEDQELLAHLIASGARIEALGQLLVGYRLSQNGLSMDLPKMYAGWQTVASRYLPQTALSGPEALYCRYLARRSLRAGGSSLLAWHFVLAGLRLDAATFLKNRRRGFSTIAGALLAPLLTAPLRRQLFA